MQGNIADVHPEEQKGIAANFGGDEVGSCSGREEGDA
jgi:hypothetical protein